MAVANSVVVRLSATWSPVTGLWILRQPAEKRYVMAMMRLKSSGQSFFKTASSIPPSSPWCSPKASIKSSGWASFQAGQQVRLGPLRLLQAHIVHHRHQVQIDGGDGKHLCLHGKGSLHNADALSVIALQIGVVGLYIKGEHPQPRRQEVGYAPAGSPRPPAGAGGAARRRWPQ